MPTFISYSQKDDSVYSTLCLAFDAAGVDRWDSVTMAAGVSLADQLKSAINSCEVCVFVATRRSIESTWCLAELGAFWGAGKRVIMFVTDPDLMEAALPPQFKDKLRVSNANSLIKAVKEALQDVNSSDLPPRSAFTPNDIKLLASARDPHYPSQTAAYAFGDKPKDWDDKLAMRFIRFAQLGLLQVVSDREIQLSDLGRRVVDKYVT